MRMQSQTHGDIEGKQVHAVLGLTHGLSILKLQLMNVAQKVFAMKLTVYKLLQLPIDLAVGGDQHKMI